jgi:hypothetical protein
MRALIALVLLLVGAIAFCQTTTEVLPGGAVQQFTNKAAHVHVQNNPAAHNATTGALETSNGGTTTYYTTTGDKQVLVGGGLVKRLYNASGTSITAIIYDDADGTCSSNAKTGTMALTNGTAYELGIEVSSGICITVGGTSPTLTVVTLP